MHIPLADICLRSWIMDDAPAIAQHGDNPKVWRNLRDRFPSPYSLDDAHDFIAMALELETDTLLCISYEGQAIGSIGLMLHQDVERFSAELGYFLAESFWGRGLATQAVIGMCDYGFNKLNLNLNRIYATPFAWNKPSCRVLEKAGFTKEGLLRQSAFKDGQFVDQIMYARLKDDPESMGTG